MDRKKDLARAISQQIAQSDVTEALSWVDSLPDKEVGSHAYDQLISQWVYRDVDGLLEHLESTGDQDRINKQASSIATQLGQINLSRAAQWATSLEDEEARANAMSRVASEWLDHNPLEASEWISTLEEGKARDEAVGSLVNEIRRSDPVSAFAWAATVGDDSSRKSLTRRVVDELKRSNQSDTALREINSSNLSDKEKEYLLGRIEK